MKKRIFLVWAQTARRAMTLADVFDAKLILLSVSRKSLFLRLTNYFYLSIRTFIILIQEEPDLIFVQSPPIHILFPLYTYTMFRKFDFVIDAHTGALVGKGWHYPIYLKLFRFFARRAVLTIIPNGALVSYLLPWRLPYFILEDGIPGLSAEPSAALARTVAVISGFGADEPLSEVIKAAKSIPDVRFYITGNFQNLGKKIPLDLPENLTFTGFLAESDYVALLKKMSLIMVLTTRPHTILCGAYEGLSLEKPMILSDTKILRSHFPKGVVYVVNTAAGIELGIQEAFSILPKLQTEIKQLKSEKLGQWTEKINQLKAQLQS